MRSFSFLQLDVFTSRPLEGNQLAVFPDARGLTDAEMQAVAKEMNLSETSFVLPREPAVEAQRGVRTRIFTTEEELPFAGHPTLGTAWALRREGQNKVVLELQVGAIPVEFEQQTGGLFGEMRQRDPEFGVIHSREDIARAAGLRPDDIAADLPIQTVSTGVAFAIVPLVSLDASRRMAPDFRIMNAYAENSDAKFFYFVCRQTAQPEARLHARMIFYNGEDPGTGSAAGCCAAWMVKHGVAKSDERVLIEQGLEMKRPCQIFVRATRQGDTVVNVRVGGQAVEIFRGELRL